MISVLIVTVLSKYHLAFFPEPHFQTVESRTISVLFKRANNEITAGNRRKDKRIVLGFVLRTFIQF